MAPPLRLGDDVNVVGFQQILAAAVSVTNVATALTAGLANRQTIGLYNNGTNTVYLGDNTVVIGTGFPLPSGAYYFADLSTFVTIYGIAIGATDVRVIEYA